jgi:hypothetical protein
VRDSDQALLAQVPAGIFGDIVYAPDVDSLSGLDATDKRFAAIFDSPDPMVFVSDESGLNADTISSKTGVGAIAVQVKDGAETLSGVLKVAITLRIHPEAEIARVKRMGRRFVFEPLRSLLKGLIQKVQAQVAVGASA